MTPLFWSINYHSTWASATHQRFLRPFHATVLEDKSPDFYFFVRNASYFYIIFRNGIKLAFIGTALRLCRNSTCAIMILLKVFSFHSAFIGRCFCLSILQKLAVLPASVIVTRTSITDSRLIHRLYIHNTHNIWKSVQHVSCTYVICIKYI